MTKAELRKIYLAKRKAFSQDEVSEGSKEIFKKFLNRFGSLKIHMAHVFLSIPSLNEVDTQLFINYFLDENIRVFVPKIIDNQLISIEIDGDTLYEVNLWNIKEPLSNIDSEITDFDMIITPLIYCDPKGNRIGYGKGFYDRLFSNISDNAIKIGIGFFSPNEDVEDADRYDVPLDYLVTPAGILSFKGLL